MTTTLGAVRVALESYGAKALGLRAQYEMRRRLGLYLPAPRLPHVRDAAICDKQPWSDHRPISVTLP